MKATCFEPLLQDEVDALTSQYAAGLRDFQAFGLAVDGSDMVRSYYYSPIMAWVYRPRVQLSTSDRFEGAADEKL